MRIFSFLVYELQPDSEDYFRHSDIGVQFSVYSSNHELVLILNKPNFTSSNPEDPDPKNSYELVIGGGDEHDTTWLSVVDREKEQKTRIQSIHTPHILSHNHPRTFWIRIGSNSSEDSKTKKYLQFGTLQSQQPPILIWPVKHNFVLNEILTKQLPGNIIDIR